MEIGTRLRKLEDAGTTVEAVEDVFVDWENAGDGRVLDFETGERVSAEEWERRHPGETLIVLHWVDVLPEGEGYYL